MGEFLNEIIAANVSSPSRIDSIPKSNLTDELGRSEPQRAKAPWKYFPIGPKNINLKCKCN